MPFRPALLALAALQALAVSAHAQEPVTPLPELSTTATRSPRAADQVPATVTRKTAEEAESRGARDAKDLFRNEVDVTVRGASPRFGMASGSTGRAGNEGLNIRGLEGNQVLLLVDGIRQPQSFAFGPIVTTRVDFLPLDAMAELEVLRGPASTQFGSDGLAGALALRTLSPQDLLGKDKEQAARLRAGWNGLDDGWNASVAVAKKLGDVKLLVLGASREGEETETQGKLELPDSRRTAPNPLRYEQHTVLAKADWQFTPSDLLQFTMEGLQRRTRTEVLSGRAVPPATGNPASTAVIDLDADDTNRRNRASLRWQHEDLNADWLQRAEVQLHGQQAKVRQFAAEDRFSAADRTRTGSYTERSWGLAAQAQAQWLPGQRWSAGFELGSTEVAAVRDGTPNPSAAPPFGEVFPAKPFPDTDFEQQSAWVQGEFQQGALTWLPALRFDRYALKPSTNGYSGGAIVQLSDQAVTPRLGLVWQISDGLQPYAQWSKGFKAPTPDQVNNGFSNVASGYRSVGNPNLKPERANSAEIGLRGQLGEKAQWRWQLAAFDNRYTDFISQQVVGGSGTPADPTVFQFINLAKAEIRGVEARLRWQQDSWQLQAALVSTRGNSETNGRKSPLDSVEPARFSLGVQQGLGEWRWRANVLHARAKPASRIAQAGAYAPAAYTVLDLGASWHPLPGLAVHLNVDNATDRHYWRWSDVRGQLASSTVIDAFTASGRTVSLQVRYDL